MSKTKIVISYLRQLLSPFAFVPNSVTEMELAAKFFVNDFVLKYLKKQHSDNNV